MDKLSRFASSFQDRSKDQQAEILASIESRGDYRPPSLPLSFTSSDRPEDPEPENEQSTRLVYEMNTLYGSFTHSFCYEIFIKRPLTL